MVQFCSALNPVSDESGASGDSRAMRAFAGIVFGRQPSGNGLQPSVPKLPHRGRLGNYKPGVNWIGHSDEANCVLALSPPA